MNETAITIGVNVIIPDETAKRCMRILEMWMDDHPDCKIECEKKDFGDHFEHKLTIRGNYGEK